MSEEKNMDWISDEGLRNNPTLQKFGDATSLAKSYIEMQTLLGGKTSYPKEGATDEDWQKFYEPLVPKEYNLKFDDLKSINSKEIVNDNFIEKAKSLGLTNKQAQGVLDAFRGTLEGKEKEVLGAKEVLTKEQEEALATKFGDKLNQVTEIVDDYVKRNYGKEVVEFFKDNIYGNAEALDALFKKAKATAPDSGMPDGAKSGFGEAKGQLEAEFKSFLNNSHPTYKGALNDNRNPQHVQAQERFAEIQHTLHLYD